MRTFKRNCYYVFSFAKWKKLCFGISPCTDEYRQIMHSLDGYVFKGNDRRISPYRYNFWIKEDIDFYIMECTKISKKEYIKRNRNQKQ